MSTLRSLDSAVVLFVLRCPWLNISFHYKPFWSRFIYFYKLPAPLRAFNSVTGYFAKTLVCWRQLFRIGVSTSTWLPQLRFQRSCIIWSIQHPSYCTWISLSSFENIEIVFVSNNTIFSSILLKRVTKQIHLLSLSKQVL